MRFHIGMRINFSLLLLRVTRIILQVERRSESGKRFLERLKKKMCLPHCASYRDGGDYLIEINTLPVIAASISARGRKRNKSESAVALAINRATKGDNGRLSRGCRGNGS